MSNRHTRQARAASRTSAPARTRPALAVAQEVPQGSRIERARARARSAKTAIGALTVLVFGVAFVGAKTHAPGHAKGKSTPLGAPSSFERAVKRSALQGGQIAPPAQPPAVSSSTS